MFLDQIAVAGGFDGFFPRGLVRIGEVTLGTVGGKFGAGSAGGGHSDCQNWPTMS